MAGATSIASAADFQKMVVESTQPVLIDFYADWCGPCKMAEPIINKLADEYAGKAGVVKVNVDDPANQEVVRNHGVMSIPTVVLYQGGKEKSRNIGFIGEDGYRKMIEDGLKG
jgi:thioredoxin 1